MNLRNNNNYFNLIVKRGTEDNTDYLSITINGKIYILVYHFKDNVSFLEEELRGLLEEIECGT